MSKENEITAAVAKKYLDSDGALSLSDYETISVKAAEILSTSQGRLLLGGLTELSDAAAESLSKNQEFLELGGLTELSDAAAESLGKHQGGLDLSGLTELSDAAAESLANSRDGLYLYGLTELSDAAAEGLSKHQGTLALKGPTKLSDAAAECLSKHQGSLELNGLAELSDAAAESLSRHQGGLHLNGLAELSDAAAESFSKHQAELSLWVLTKLSDAAAGSLSRHIEEVCLWGLKEISEKGYTYLYANGKIILPEKGVEKFGLDPEMSYAAARLIASERKLVNSLYLRGLRRISVDAARGFSEFNGYLELGIVEISDEIAEILSQHKGDLFFSGLSELPESCDVILDKHQGDIFLSKPKKIKTTKISNALSAKLKKLEPARSSMLEKLLNIGVTKVSLNYSESDDEGMSELYSGNDAMENDELSYEMDKLFLEFTNCIYKWTSVSGDHGSVAWDLNKDEITIFHNSNNQKYKVVI
jgi:hypothetical protein